MSEILKEALKRIENNEIIALATIVETEGSAPNEKGAKMLVGKNGLISGTIGGGIIEAKVVEEAKKAIKSGKKKNLQFDLNKEEIGLDETPICGGKIKIFIDILMPKEKILIFGAGHIALCLSRFAKILRFGVIIIDERKEFANRTRFPEAEKIINEKAALALKQFKINPCTYVVIVTKGHLNDEDALISVIKQNVKYVGMIGSRAKNNIIFSHLREKGVTEKQINKIYAPIGLSIGARTPEEIAVSIIAEIISVKRKTSKKERE